MLRAVGRCPTALRTFRARNSRMVLAELVLSESRGPVSFIKHLFIFGLFQYAEGWISRPLPMQIRIGGNGRVATTSVQTRRHATLLSKRGAFTEGSARPHSRWKARRTAYLAGKIISPRKSILHIFSAQAHDRSNSRPIGPETSEKAHPSQRIPSVISAAEFLQ